MCFGGRFICLGCAGSVADVAEWATYDLGPLRCDCRAVELSPIAGPDGWPVAKAGNAAERLMID